jgi:hypothetical protein
MAGRIKVTGYYTPDIDDHFDPDHESGLTAEGQDEALEYLTALDEVEFTAE